ncbi:hypothetical protein HFK83_03090 [Ralstonia pseudosolanacearum]|uniref:hypothetical protein n=1 Tax=Ralstonia pseudosolanacearum TaxID=1310165 RepID=UPI00200626FA|nr:hypothetical protein [Ralstonia pseudosolanacearum]MCK4121356.1 hypothetical protein [Ralstonia pseudosolanacearum]
MRVPSQEIVDYHEYRTLSEAYGPGAQLAKEPTWKEWAEAIATGIGAGAVMFLVVAYAAGALIR